MIRKWLIMVLCFGIFCLLTPYSTQAGWKDYLKDIKKELTGEKGLSENDIIMGLKQALEVGTKNVVSLVSNMDGYYKNPKIKIPLPEKMKKVDKYLRKIGFGSKMDEFVLSMNRAAEKAAPQAKKIFWNAIKQMKFSDAKQILKGRNNEATLYFKEKTFISLENIFQLVVNKSMEKVGVTRLYKHIHSTVKAIPFLETHNLDLDQYVTRKALNGLFIMVAEEEDKIRKDPKARVTELLKKVFG